MNQRHLEARQHTLVREVDAVLGDKLRVAGEVVDALEEGYVVAGPVTSAQDGRLVAVLNERRDLKEIEFMRKQTQLG